MEKNPSTSSSAAKKSATRFKCTHPPVATMVNKAIEALDTKGGTSVMAIKKYMQVHFCVEADKLTPFIKKYLAKAVENNVLIQATGKGLTGSYKLAGKSKRSKEAKLHVTASDEATNKADRKNVKNSSSQATKSKSITLTKSRSKSATPIKQKPVSKRNSLLSTTTKSKSSNLTNKSKTPINPRPFVGERASRDSILLMQKREQT